MKQTEYGNPELEGMIGGSDQSKMIAFSKHWQRPAATEEFAFQALDESEEARTFDYVGFAWATLFDGLSARTPESKEILQALLEATQSSSAQSSIRRATVAQHIRASDYFDLFKSVGITDVFWSHAVHGQAQIDGIRVHPFPLFPAQAPTYQASSRAAKTHVANFVGAYNPSIYLSNVREVIFGDEGAAPDLNIVKRDRWHFDRAVYDEQISGQSASQAQLAAEAQMKRDYIDAIQTSWFTLCPTGSGPNSIRIFESLSLGSIPIVLTRDLRLVGPSDLWERAAIIEDDSEAGYRRGLERARRTTEQERLDMMAAGKTLFDQVGPNAFGRIITQAIK